MPLTGRWLQRASQVNVRNNMHLGSELRIGLLPEVLQTASLHAVVRKVGRREPRLQRRVHIRPPEVQGRVVPVAADGVIRLGYPAGQPQVALWLESQPSGKASAVGQASACEGWRVHHTPRANTAL
jgi:hypothetical protein